MPGRPARPHLLPRARPRRGRRGLEGDPRRARPGAARAADRDGRALGGGRGRDVVRDVRQSRGQRDPAPLPAERRAARTATGEARRARPPRLLHVARPAGRGRAARREGDRADEHGAPERPRSPLAALDVHHEGELARRARRAGLPVPAGRRGLGAGRRRTDAHPSSGARGTPADGCRRPPGHRPPRPDPRRARGVRAALVRHVPARPSRRSRATSRRAPPRSSSPSRPASSASRSASSSSARSATRSDGEVLCSSGSPSTRSRPRSAHSLPGSPRSSGCGSSRASPPVPRSSRPARSFATCIRGSRRRGSSPR